MTRGVSPQASVVDSPTDSSSLPDLRDALDLDPVQLDVLPVGDVGGAAGEPAGDVADHVQLLAGELAAVDPDAEHEVTVVQLLGLQDRGLAAVDARLALRVQAEPAEPAAQVGRVDRVESPLGVDVDDPLADVQPVVVLLVFLVLVERLAVSERPLTFAARATGSALSGARWHAAGVLRLSGARARAGGEECRRSTPFRDWPGSPPSGLGTAGCGGSVRDTRPVPRHAPGLRHGQVVSGRADRWRCGREAGRHACVRRARDPRRSRQ